LRASEERVAQRSAVFSKELGLRDLVLTQILFIIGLSWVGAAAKLGPSHVVFWLLAIAFFYLPSAAVVIYLNRLMPLEGGLYQWAKLGFSEAAGFMVAWNLWLYVITNTSEIGLQLTTNLAYAIGPQAAWISSNKWLITLTSVIVIGLLVVVSTIGLSVGKWIHNIGGIIMLTIFAALLVLPFIHVARGEMREFHPLATAMPVVSLFSLNILANSASARSAGLNMWPSSRANAAARRARSDVPSWSRPRSSRSCSFSAPARSLHSLGRIRSI
jgi:amino acid transporter